MNILTNILAVMLGGAIGFLSYDFLLGYVSAVNRADNEAAEIGDEIRELGWSREQALETRMRLQTFEEDWNAPGMEGYDEL